MALRALLIAHRYLAITVGLLMALWCLSGFVMLYQEFPDFTRAERLQSLEPIALDQCCDTTFLPADATIAGNFRIEMLRGRPVLRQDGAAAVFLDSGTPLRGLTQTETLEVAALYARRWQLDAVPTAHGEIDIDQWTILTAPLNRPAHHITLGDAAGTELYLNAATGEIFQQSTRRERVLAWFGAIPHWLYPTALRRNGPLWKQIVIWTSVAGSFLAATGLYVGISRWQRRRDQSVSPFRGWWYWHHLAGLVFGVFALTWVFSGLLTVNPWGLLLGGEQAPQIRRQIAGSFTTGELRQFLQAAPARIAAGEFTQLRAQPFGGRLHVIAQRPDGSTLRLDASALPAPLAPNAVTRAIHALAPGSSPTLLHTSDAYYYPHKDQVELPVYRAVLPDADGTLVYISAGTGSLRIIDRDGKAARWLQRGLHGLDFAGLRSRPLWDVVVLLLLAGVTVLCITGSWMAVQRLRRDLRGGRRS